MTKGERKVLKYILMKWMNLLIGMTWILMDVIVNLKFIVHSHFFASKPGLHYKFLWYCVHITMF